MTSPKRVSKIIKILNRFAVEFGEDVAGQKASLGGRRARADVGEPYSVGQLGEVRNAAEIGAVAAAGHLAGVRVSDFLRGLSFGYPNELGTGRAIGKMIGDVGHQVEQTHSIGRVDLVPGVAGLVIIGVQAGEKEQ